MNISSMQLHCCTVSHVCIKIIFNIFVGKESQKKACHGCHHCPTVHTLMLFLRLHQSTEIESVTKKFEHSHYGNVLFINIYLLFILLEFKQFIYGTADIAKATFSFTFYSIVFPCRYSKIYKGINLNFKLIVICLS